MKKLFKNVLAFTMAATLAVGSTVVASAEDFVSEFTLKWEKVDFASELAKARKAQPEYFLVNDLGDNITVSETMVVREADRIEFNAYLETMAVEALKNNTTTVYDDNQFRVLCGGGSYVAIYKPTGLVFDYDRSTGYEPVEHYILATSKNARDWTVVGSFFDRIYDGLYLSNLDSLTYTNGNFFLGVNKYSLDWSESYLLRSADGINWYRAYVPFSFELLDPERKANGDYGVNNTGDIHIVSNEGPDFYGYGAYGTFAPVDASFTKWEWATTTEEAYAKLTNDHDAKYGYARSDYATYPDFWANEVDIVNDQLVGDGAYGQALADVIKVYVRLYYTVNAIN